jgi:hypothetical protein
MRAILERYTPKLNSSNILEHVFYDISDIDSISVFRLKQKSFYSVLVLPSCKIYRYIITVPVQNKRLPLFKLISILVGKGKRILCGLS